MFERPDLWPDRQRVQWACALMELLGETSLVPLPTLMTGLTSVRRSAPGPDEQRAILTTRQIIPHYTNRRAVQHAVAQYREHLYETRTSGSYEIDPKTLAFTRVSRLADTDVTKARAMLLAGLPRRRAALRMADPTREMVVRHGGDAEATVIPALGIQVPPSPQHDLTRRPVSRIEFSWFELGQIAEELDAIDRRTPGLRRGNWAKRFLNMRLKVPRGVRLEHVDTLTLTELKHLVGLPGAGKTTLLVLLGVACRRRGWRVMFFFPSVEVSRQYLEWFERYDAPAGMLVGQHPITRKTHADRLAETVAAQGDSGFGHTVPGAREFAQLCVLPAFSAQGTRAGWSYADAPCDRIEQRDPETGRVRRHLCPLWSRCGRNHAPRELTRRNLWVGHVLSADTRVPQQATSEQWRYFELIARTFDLVVFDECDMAQALLDGYGSATMNLTGHAGSLHAVSHEQVLRRLAGVENHRLFDPRTVTYAKNLSEFGEHNHMLVHVLQTMDPAASAPFESQLITTARLITQWLSGERGRAGPGRSVVDALVEVWDASIYEAFYDRTALTARPWAKLEACAELLGLPVSTVEQRQKDLSRVFRRYLAEDTMAGRDSHFLETERLMTALAFPSGPVPRHTRELLRLLTTVSFMILAYKRIVFSQRELANEEMLQQPFSTLTASPTLQRLVPANILGALSGVRFTFSPGSATDQRGVQISYLVMNSAPRMLMHRFRELYGPAEGGPCVLLTSATSFLEASPAYHVAQGPHYVLSPQKSEYDARQSRYVFRPVMDGVTLEPLRFSGGGVGARRNLTRMLEDLVSGGTEDNEIFRQLRSLEREGGVRRKAAIIVNSYEQVRDLVAYLAQHHPEVARRTRGVVNALRSGEGPERFITSAMVEHVGDDTKVDVLIMPMLAVGRGVNVVFTRGDHATKAALGVLYFLTRPHPGSDSLDLLFSLAARATQEMDAWPFPPGTSAEEMKDTLARRRYQTYLLATRLLREPLRASRLGPTLFRAFTANMMVPILQTIGRAMRGGMPARVYFVDAAWAPASARGETDQAETSMLVMMRSILEELTGHPDGALRETYLELYGAFLEPLRRAQNVHFPSRFPPMSGEPEDEGEEKIGPSTYLLEDPDDFARPLAPTQALDLTRLLEDDDD